MHVHVHVHVHVNMLRTRHGRGMCQLIDSRALAPCSQAISIDQVAEQRATGDPVHDPDCEACVVCLDEAKTHILIPCGHQCVCGPCSERLAQGHCPVCRTAVTMAVRVYK